MPENVYRGFHFRRLKIQMVACQMEVNRYAKGSLSSDSNYRRNRNLMDVVTRLKKCLVSSRQEEQSFRCS